MGDVVVGLDLAWVERNASGWCAIEASHGSVVDVRLVRGDAEIVDLLGRVAPVVTAVDAPLVVTNATGRRPCEAVVAAEYRRFHAGPHPSNLSLPSFRGGVRARVLADAAGLSVDPAAGGRRMVEVFPHPTTIELFGLDRVIPYKQKRGRDLASLTLALGVLCDHVETLERADVPIVLGSPWSGLRDALTAARTKAALKRVEDQVDAVLCAYVALLAHVAPARLRVVGDVDTGYIVLPTPRST